MNNAVFLKGRAGKDIEIKYLPNGTAVGNFSLAIGKKVKDEWMTQWVNCVSWALTAESLRGVLVKGADVAVSGELQVRSYQTKDGQKREVYEVVAWSVTVQPRKEREERKETPDFTAPIDSEDVPF